MQVSDDVFVLFSQEQKMEWAELVGQESKLSERRVATPQWMWQQEEEALRQRVQELIAGVVKPMR